MAFKKLKYWFGEELAEMLADKICVVQSNFDKTRFVKAIAEKVDELELKDRVKLIADLLYRSFGEDYQKGLSILMQILGPENPKETGMFTEYYWLMPVAKYVEKYGLQHYSDSIQAIGEITKRNTGEYAIRPYLERYPDRTLQIMEAWSKDDNVHLRRLASEGIRPRLPWATKLDIFIEHPEKTLPILNNLKDDTSNFVQKSVANCINDILKDNIETAKRLIESWNGKGISQERQWIIRHALRKLIKNKDEWALEMVR